MMTTQKRLKLGVRTSVVLRQIALYIKKHGYSPTLRELMIQCELSSTSVVNHHVSKLIEKGYLTKDENSARTLKITAKGKKNLSRTVIQ